jgi:AcrR family transcriptional regulator
LSAVASVPVSSIYHHFGSLEQLLVISQEQAQAQALLWCDDRLVQLAGMPCDSRAFPAFFAACVDDWVTQQRRLAFVWREGQLLRTDSPTARNQRMQWQELWSAFWHKAMACFGLEKGAGVANRLFENESFLHMIDWRRAVDRAGLDEFARGLGAWLTGEAVPPSPWRDFARAAALDAMPGIPDHDDMTGRIVTAAALLIEQSGPGGLTHRAVAEQAGLTLGTVSHKVRTKADLMQLGYEALYIKAVTRLRAQTAALPSGGQSLGGIADFIAASSGNSGIDALHLAVARDPALRQFGLQLRYLRGETSRGLFGMLLPQRPEPGHLEAALLSAFLSSLSRNHVDWTTEESRTPIRMEIEGLTALFQ